MSDWTESLTAHADRAYLAALRATGDGSLAEEAVQEAFARLLREKVSDTLGVKVSDTFSPDERLAYLLRTVHNAAVNMAKSAAARRRREEAHAMSESRTVPEPGEQAAALEAARAARAALLGLPAELRQAVSLCCEQGLTCRQAAGILGAPERTVSDWVRRGLKQLREVLAAGGFAAVSAEGLSRALGELGIPPAPATLAAAIGKILSGNVAIKGTGAAASAAVKGGIAVKVIAGVVAAGVLAGAVAVVNSVGAGFKPAPTTLSSPPAAAAAAGPNNGQPAPVNEYKGMQEREEVFEFTEKSKVTKDGDKWVITFASKGKCDATVAILDKDGKIIRHLASGVLGVNAPYPFQQNSLSQKLEWDGQTDDFKKAPDGCKVKVSLGLKAKFERNIASDPYFMQIMGDRKKMLTATGADGTIYVLNYTGAGMAVRAYGKDGKYLRTVIPPAAAELEKVAPLLGGKVVTTGWGDKSPAGGRDGPVGFEFTRTEDPGALGRAWATSMAAVKDVAKVKGGTGDEGQRLVALAAKLEKCTDGAKWEIGPCPAVIPEYKGPPLPPGNVLRNCIGFGSGRVSVDYSRELLYANSAGGQRPLRFDGKTGAWDSAWKSGEKIGTTDQVIVGYDDLIYWRCSCCICDYGPPFAARMTQEGQFVPFKQNRIDDPALGKKFEENPKNQGRSFVKSGNFKSSPLLGALMVSAPSAGGDANHNNGWDVAPDGNIIVDVFSRGMHQIAVFDRDGKQFTDDAVKDALTVVNGNLQGDGVYMDRDGNVYVVYGSLYPDGVKYKEGWGGGGLFKFRGLGGKYPVGQFHKSPPADAIKLRCKYPDKGGLVGITGALWVYGGGATNESFGDCNCPHTRFWLDRFARSWVPANQVESVMLLDSNGNRIARLGKYGNADDSEEDVKAGKDGLRFVWTRAVCASDNAMYAVDFGNMRILKAALSYAAEETVPLP